MQTKMEMLQDRLDRLDAAEGDRYLTSLLEEMDRDADLKAELQIAIDEVEAGNVVPWEGADAFMERMRARHARS